MPFRSVEAKAESLGASELVQSRFGIKLRFQFGEEQLVFTVRDPTGEQRSSVAYEHIWVRNPSYLTIDNAIFGQRLALLYLSGLVALVSAIFYFRLGVVTASALTLALLAATGWMRMRTPFAVHFTVLPVTLDASGLAGPPIHIMEDETGELLIAEIARRRRERLRTTMAFVDHANDPEHELAKFAWLKENEVIDEFEFQAALAELAATSLNEGKGPLLH